MDLEFYIASHDYLSSPEPRLCRILKTIKGENNRKFLLVCIKPPLPGRIVQDEKDLNELLIEFVDTRASVQDVGRIPVMVRIFAGVGVLQDYVSDADIRKIGVGTLHASFPEAMRASPLETGH